MTAGGYLLPGLIAGYMRSHSAHSLSLSIANTRGIEELLLARKLELALVEGPFERGCFMSEEFTDDELVPVFAPGFAAENFSLAEYLQNHPKVAWVTYSGLPCDKYHALAQKYLPNGGCGVVSFGVKGGRKAAETFMKHLKLAAIETHVADARTCCLHPASATHRQMNDEELAAAGVSPDLVRFSCGLEDSRDLIADIAQALEAVAVG